MVLVEAQGGRGQRSLISAFLDSPLQTQPETQPDRGGMAAMNLALQGGQPRPHTTRAGHLPTREEKWREGRHTLGFGVLTIVLQHPLTSHDACDIDGIVPVF